MAKFKSLHEQYFWEKAYAGALTTGKMLNSSTNAWAEQTADMALAGWRERVPDPLPETVIQEARIRLDVGMGELIAQFDKREFCDISEVDRTVLTSRIKRVWEELSTILDHAAQ